MEIKSKLINKRSVRSMLSQNGTKSVDSIINNLKSTNEAIKDLKQVKLALNSLRSGYDRRAIDLFKKSYGLKSGSNVINAIVQLSKQPGANKQSVSNMMRPNSVNNNEPDNKPTDND